MRTLSRASMPPRPGPTRPGLSAAGLELDARPLAALPVGRRRRRRCQPAPAAARGAPALREQDAADNDHANASKRENAAALFSAARRQGDGPGLFSRGSPPRSLLRRWRPWRGR